MAAASASAIPPINQNERFYRYFREEATALQSEMSFLGQVSTIGGERLDAIDHCRSGIARLQKEVEDASSYVPAHDQKIYGEAIHGLNEKLTLTRAEILPQSRFSFKNKTPDASISFGSASPSVEDQKLVTSQNQTPVASNASSVSTTPAYLATPPNERDSTSSGSNRPEVLRRGSLGLFLRAAGVPNPSASPMDGLHATSSKDAVHITNEHSAHIILPSAAAHATAACTVTSVRNAVVDTSERIVGPKPTDSTWGEISTKTTGQGFAALVVRNVRASLLICGAVSGAAHVTSMENSVLVVAAGQMRLHDCRDCVIYLHVTSRPVIEDCSGMRFAPLPQAYMHFALNRLAENQWDQVQDFKWLKAEPSPNWQILPAEERVKDEVWTDIVPGGPGHATGDILAAVGVSGN